MNIEIEYTFDLIADTPTVCEIWPYIIPVWSGTNAKICLEKSVFDIFGQRHSLMFAGDS